MQTRGDHRNAARREQATKVLPPKNPQIHPTEEAAPAEGEASTEEAADVQSTEEAPPAEGEAQSTEEAPPAEGEVSTEEAAPAEEETPDPEASILSQVPENTAVTVLDENGEAQPLATQAAAEAISTSDPIWCPAGQTSRTRSEMAVPSPFPASLNY
jgi:hypothetical protein